MGEAKEQWDQWAQEIKEGKRKDFITHLEERGLIHDAVGYDSPRLARKYIVNGIFLLFFAMKADQSLWTQ